MLFPVIYAVSRNVISLPVSGCGPTHCVRQDGPTTGPYGQAPALANLSARRAKEMGSLTSGTYGPHSTISSESAALQSSLASRLRQRTDLLGSTLYKLTWKERVTPAGRSIPALRASVRRTSDSDCIGWPTPRAVDGEKNSRTLEGAMREMERGKLSCLPGLAALAGWPTPTTQDDNCSRVENPQEYAEKRLSRNGACSNLAQTAQAFAHNSPARLTASGELLTGSCAGMESGGQLDPAHSRWLMGLPPEWDDCAAMVTPSTRNKRKSS